MGGWVLIWFVEESSSGYLFAVSRCGPGWRGREEGSGYGSSAACELPAECLQKQIPHSGPHPWGLGWHSALCLFSTLPSSLMQVIQRPVFEEHWRPREKYHDQEVVYLSAQMLILQSLTWLCHQHCVLSLSMALRKKTCSKPLVFKEVQSKIVFFTCSIGKYFSIQVIAPSTGKDPALSC